MPNTRRDEIPGVPAVWGWTGRHWRTLTPSKSGSIRESRRGFVFFFSYLLFTPDETSAVFLLPFHPTPPPIRQGMCATRCARERKKNKGFLYYLLYPTPSPLVSGYDLVTRATREHTGRELSHVSDVRWSVCFMHDTIALPGKIKRKLFNGKLNACFSIFLALSFPRRSIGIRAHARPEGGPYTTSALKLKNILVVANKKKTNMTITVS